MIYCKPDSIIFETSGLQISLLTIIETFQAYFSKNSPHKKPATQFANSYSDTQPGPCLNYYLPLNSNYEHSECHKSHEDPTRGVGYPHQSS